MRALVLDGALDPSQGIVEETVAHYAAVQRAFDAFAADCASRPNCPLGQDPARATAAFQAMVRPLIEAPLRVGDRTLYFTDAVLGVASGVLNDRDWPVITLMLTAMRAGDGSGLLSAADDYHQRARDGTYEQLHEATTAISCVDHERITDRTRAAALAQQIVEAAPFIDSGRGVVAALGPCAFWPGEPTSTPHVPDVHGLPPTLVISVTGDANTPFQAGVRLATELGGRLIAVEGRQHGVALVGTPCIDEVVVDYLVDLTVPAGQTTCMI